MNIQEAKDCVRDAVSAYLDKDTGGNYIIPRSRQRPIVVMGAPGLGKTAIMSQIASELGIGYVGYAMTHHTRQSAIGLPMIDTESYGGSETHVTRYTMSEIIASVYDAMEEFGHREGILFIDEVNCVSETLSATMLDLLQNKKFGPHRIPDGWVLVAAGNPPEFNSSAREFDIATLDRIRQIDVEPDAEVWIRYARSSGVHDAVTYYLQVKPQNLLIIENTPTGPVFATPRAWEDLSTVLKEHDRLGLTVDVKLISQYIRYPEIAAEFKRYLDFHRKYSQEYDVASILDGRAVDTESIVHAGAEEKLSVISVMIGSLNKDAERGMDVRHLLESVYGCEAHDLKSGCTHMREELRSNPTPDRARTLNFCISMMDMQIRTPEELDAYHDNIRNMDAVCRSDFERRLTNAMEFMNSAFPNGQETISLLTGLLGCYNVVMYSEPDGALYSYNDSMLSEGNDIRIQKALEAME